MNDQEEITEALAQVREERSQMIALRRGAATRPAQSLRVERVSRGRQFRGDGSAERRADVIIMGAPDADIEMDDRFNDENGTLYKVSFIEPNRSVATLAEALIIG